MEKKKSGFRIWLGLFITLGLALFVGTIFIIGKQKNLFDSVFKLSTNFYNVSGLQVGNKVRFSGINVGTVDKITIINDSTVRVEMVLDEMVQRFIKVDCKASIGGEGIIGDRVLNISQSENASAQMVKNGQHLKSSEPIETDVIMAKMDQISDDATHITKDLAEIIHNINSGNGTMARLIRDPSIANNLSQTISNLKSSTKGLDENMEAAKHNFLLRGYYKQKERKARERKEAAEAEKKEKLKKKESPKKEK